MVVGQYLTQNVTGSYKLFEILHEIKIQMGINSQVLVVKNGYLNSNVIKYAYENNMGLLIPNIVENNKSKPNNKEKTLR